ncbi:hypothetical protein RRG08_020911 [Elysia crispata]|uniref:Uncharacterized protein n=1 Tax=Elysia crispata TaxID=231223 RepID=A0AAE1AEQ1_9GAST|nr:hypothetical protein RRG08_020911 [Elysia crispata]
MPVQSPCVCVCRHRLNLICCLGQGRLNLELNLSQASSVTVSPDACLCFHFRIFCYHCQVQCVSSNDKETNFKAERSKDPRNSNTMARRVLEAEHMANLGIRELSVCYDYFSTTMDHTGSWKQNTWPTWASVSCQFVKIIIAIAEFIITGVSK